MADKLNSLFILVNFGSLILLSFLSLANPLKANKIATRLLGVFFLLWASFWVEQITLLIYNSQLDGKWILFYWGWQNFTPILFYFSIVFYANPGFKFKKETLTHLVLPVGNIILLYYLGKTYSLTLNYVLLGLQFGMMLLYTMAAYFKIRKHQKVVLLYSSQTSEVDLAWLERVTIGFLLIVVYWIIYSIIFLFEYSDLTLNVICLIGIFYIAFHSMRQKETYPFKEASIEEVISLSEEPEIDESKKKIVSDEELITLKSRLTQFMLNQKPYLDTDLNLIKLAELFGTNAHKLSYIINSGFNINFFNFINQYRVEEAKLLLLNSKMDQYSILGIAYEAGFNSKTAFNTAFKKIANQTPSDFKKSSSTL